MATSGSQPYTSYAPVLTAGLTTIVNALKGTPAAPSDLVNAVCSYFQKVFYPSTGNLPADIQVQLQATTYKIINNYNNSISPKVAPLLTCAQSYFEDLMVGLPLITDLTANQTDTVTWLNDIRDNITKADLTTDDQAALMLAVLFLNGISSYFANQINNTIGFWAPYFSTNPAENFANLKIWTAAAVSGVLIGYSASPKGLIPPTNDFASVSVISASIGLKGYIKIKGF